MEKDIQKKKIFVGVSGGVDSSVSLALLKEQGHDVVGVFIRTWQPDWIACTWKEERRDALRVCASLDIPFLELDLQENYRVGVAEYMVREYQAGRTPNPDVMCNREVKFGGFLNFARAHGADYVATGHYARIQVDPQGHYQLCRGVDTSKDQSYFLWMLTQEELKYTMFPVGNYPKSQVREFAKEFLLPTATKKDSQGICFIGEIDMKDFLKHYLDEQPGDVIDTQGTVIGSHYGARFFTLGERHGFSINPKYKGTSDTPFYVVKKNLENNTLTVSPNAEYASKDSLELISVNNQGSLQQGDLCEAQIRYRGEIYQISILEYNDQLKTMKCAFIGKKPLVAPGQSIVFYRGELCLGGGIVHT